jgi:hypothetical protein
MVEGKYPTVLKLQLNQLNKHNQLNQLYTRTPQTEYLSCTPSNVKKRKQTLIINSLTGIKTVSIFIAFLNPLQGKGLGFTI